MSCWVKFYFIYLFYFSNDNIGTFLISYSKADYFLFFRVFQYIKIEIWTSSINYKRDYEL